MLFLAQVFFAFLARADDGCADGTVDQIFQTDVMIGCDGAYTRNEFRTACSNGWHVARAFEYFAYGGTTIVPNAERWVDVTWDSSGKETSLENWGGYYASSNQGGWNSLGSNSDCVWVSKNEWCTLSFVDYDYGSSYGCHCRGNGESGTHGVICVKDTDGCADGSLGQIFQTNEMIGCDGAYTRHNFRAACSNGWNVASASEYFSYGGTSVVPNAERWVDVTWDLNGKETSLDNWEGYYDSSNSGGWSSLSSNSNCVWVSKNEQCTLSFIDHDYGSSYGCHCRGNGESGTHGVICVWDGSTSPTKLPTVIPTKSPTSVPTVIPTVSPTPSPSTVYPTYSPSTSPTASPTVLPSVASTQPVSATPSNLPTSAPTEVPTSRILSSPPSMFPSKSPSTTPTTATNPSTIPTISPSMTPTSSTSPSTFPSKSPSTTPTTTAHPSPRPTISPSLMPTSSTPPSTIPSKSPSTTPTTTTHPSTRPTISPSLMPTSSAPPSTIHTKSPTAVPTSTSHPTTAPIFSAAAEREESLLSVGFTLIIAVVSVFFLVLVIVAYCLNRRNAKITKMNFELQLKVTELTARRRNYDVNDVEGEDHEGAVYPTVS